MLLALLVTSLPLASLPQKKIGTDFLAFWTAGELLASGQSPYDSHLQARVQQGLGWRKEEDGMGVYASLPYYYPPWLGLACVPLLPLGYPAARAVWVFLCSALLPASGYLLSRTGRGVPPSLAVLIIPAFTLSIVSAVRLGQTAPLLLFLVVVAWRLLQSRQDRAAGAVLAWLTIKPQLTAVLLAGVLVWAARQRRPKVVQGFLLALTLLCAASTLVVPSWPIDMLGATRAHPLPTDYNPLNGTTWFSALKVAGLRGWCFWASYLAVALALPAAALRVAWTRTRPLSDVLAVSLLAAFFVSPYCRAYDFPVLLVPLFVLLADRCPKRTALKGVFLFAALNFLQLFVLIDGIHTTISFFVWVLPLCALWFTTDPDLRALLRRGVVSTVNQSGRASGPDLRVSGGPDTGPPATVGRA